MFVERWQTEIAVAGDTDNPASLWGELLLVVADWKIVIGALATDEAVLSGEQWKLSPSDRLHGTNALRLAGLLTVNTDDDTTDSEQILGNKPAPLSSDVAGSIPECCAEVT